MSVGIIILNYNGFKDTISCIQSIEKYNSADIRYIVVDNGSSRKEESVDLESFLRDTFPDQYIKTDDQIIPEQRVKAVLIQSPSNDGYAKGNNKGLKIALADPEISDVLILNNDVLFESDIIPALLSCRAQLTTPGILTPIILNKHGGVEHNCARRFPSNWEVMLPFLFFKKDLFRILSKSSNSQKILKSNPQLVQYPFFPIGMPSGAFMLMDKTTIEKTGGFDEGTFLYYEENILCKKLNDLGLINYCVTSCHALHIGGASTSKTPNLFLQKCSLNSADYYLDHFAGLSFIQRIAWRLIRSAWTVKFRIK